MRYANKDGIINIYISVNHSCIDIGITYTGADIEKDCSKAKYIKRMDKSFTKNSNESEIGLKLSEVLVEAHGGSISYFTKSNDEKSFVVKLPRKTNDTVYTLYSDKKVNYESLNEMIKI